MQSHLRSPTHHILHEDNSLAPHSSLLELMGCSWAVLLERTMQQAQATRSRAWRAGSRTHPVAPTLLVVHLPAAAKVKGRAPPCVMQRLQGGLAVNMKRTAAVALARVAVCTCGGFHVCTCDGFHVPQAARTAKRPQHSSCLASFAALAHADPASWRACIASHC